MAIFESADRDAFATITSIELSEHSTWADKVFLTIDVDWAHDDVIADTLEIVEAAAVPATWFITHDTPLIARLRANPLFELGVHPNFLPLLLYGSDEKGASAGAVLDDLLAIVPEAKAVRTHSLVQCGRLTELYHQRGLTHDASTLIPTYGAHLQPWIDWFGVTRVPHHWEDDYWCYVDRPAPDPVGAGLRVFAFHPIHVFLNTEHLDRYEKARPDFMHPERLIDRRGVTDGTRDYLLRLLDRAS